MSADHKTLFETGRQVFSANCAACHGEDATGSTDMGAPSLNDKTVDATCPPARPSAGFSPAGATSGTIRCRACSK
ncbi:MAG TPA: hypothetical protein DIC56_03070 [Rhizobium sp.]|nr:hypothetical protein [Rhizobium sp.]